MKSLWNANDQATVATTVQGRLMDSIDIVVEKYDIEKTKTMKIGKTIQVNILLSQSAANSVTLEALLQKTAKVQRR